MSSSRFSASSFPYNNESDDRRGPGQTINHASVENKKKTANAIIKRKSKSEHRGFIITMDAITALTFMLLSLYFIQSTSFNPNMLKSTQLKQISLDTMTVLEKSGRLNNVFFVNGTVVKEVFLATPDQVCMQLKVTAANGTDVATVDKPGCDLNVSESQTVYGMFRTGGTVFSTTLTSWYNQEAKEVVSG